MALGSSLPLSPNRCEMTSILTQGPLDMQINELKVQMDSIKGKVSHS